ncbi:hypothetical protein BC834DRAFT_813789, partial [Gloeopeniophorella convolvens]
EKELPKAMVILAATAVHSALFEHATGVLLPSAFTHQTYSAVYAFHDTVLTGIFQNRPRKYHQLMHTLYKQA